ncbi:hypothetical protein MKX01_013428 [Papaver californicum]|nr:hypothetical protein MKX01_013428 [Papaver californicum]
MGRRRTGTGCLKFSSPAEADAAVAAARNTGDSGILLKGRQLNVIKALDKKSARCKELEKAKSDDVDQRNLYLAKEGVIPEGSPDAEGVSVSDMIIRQLDYILTSSFNLKILERTKAAKEHFPRGTAFVEFSEHQHALAALNVFNNNPGKYS